MSVYTRTGDDGTTGLLGGVRVKKTDARVEALGTLDELNASIGLSICMIPRTLGKQIKQELIDVQNNLFSIGSNCATPSKTQLKIHTRATGFPTPHIPSKPTTDDIFALEKAIDRYDTELTPLSGFILPGGSPEAAQLHVARSICRRAERRLGAIKTNKVFMKYINRLSDYLFTCARVMNARTHVKDILCTK